MITVVKKYPTNKPLLVMGCGGVGIVVNQGVSSLPNKKKLWSHNLEITVEIEKVLNRLGAYCTGKWVETDSFGITFQAGHRAVFNVLYKKSDDLYQVCFSEKDKETFIMLTDLLSYLKGNEFKKRLKGLQKING